MTPILSHSSHFTTYPARSLAALTNCPTQHPGGKKILLKNCGKDASDAFWSYHSEKVMEKPAKPLLIGQGEYSKPLLCHI